MPKVLRINVDVVYFLFNPVLSNSHSAEQHVRLDGSFHVAFSPKSASHVLRRLHASDLLRKPSAIRAWQPRFTSGSMVCSELRLRRGTTHLDFSVVQLQPSIDSTLEDELHLAKEHSLRSPWR